MIKKRETCLYCGDDMESETAKKKFCSTKCRVYWNREKSFEGIIPTIKKTKQKTFSHPSVKEVEKFFKEETKKHKLWKQGDPPEGSNAFFLRYGVRNYDEIEN